MKVLEDECDENGTSCANYDHLAKLTVDVYERIQQALTSPIRLAYVDLFVGPLIGRDTSTKKICSLAQEIGSSMEFHMSEPLLVLRCSDGLLSGKLPVLGGGHRLLTGALQKHMLLFPYQVVDLSGLMDCGTPLDFKHHEFLLIHHIQASESRPDGYGIMAQVAQYGKLKQYWLWMEKQRIQEVQRTRPSAKPNALTHRKLYNLYEVLYKPAKRRGKYAISFLNSEVEKTRTGYMSEADRLLEAKVVSDLCFLEGAANTKFLLSTLNMVRNWTLRKISRSVDDLFEAYEEKPGTVLKFFDDGKQRPRKKEKERKQRQPVRQNQDKISEKNRPPIGWEHYVDWGVKDDLAFLDELKSNLFQEENKFQHQAGSSVTVIEDNADKIRIVDIVRDHVQSMMKKGESTFDMAKLISERVSHLAEQTHSSCVMMVTGGVLRQHLNLNRKDMNSITELNWATDQAVMYTLFFLSNWTISAIGDVYDLDPVFTQGWWENVFMPRSKALRDMKRKMRLYPKTKTNKHELVWRSKIPFIFMCGKKHWTVAVIFGLPDLLEWLQNKADFMETSSASAPKLAKSIIFDSIGKKDSPHAELSSNLVHYLCFANPGQELIVSQLNDLLNVHEHRVELQKSAECGFFATYYASLVLRNPEVFRTGTVYERASYLNSSYRNYSFSHYAHIIQCRMRVMSFKSEKNGRQPVHINVFLWDNHLPMPPQRSVVRAESTIHVKGVSANERPSFRTRSKTKTLSARKLEHDTEHGLEEGNDIFPTPQTNPVLSETSPVVNVEDQRPTHEADGNECNLKIAQNDSSNSQTKQNSFVKVLVDFTLRTIVATEYHQETMKSIYEDPNINKALLSEGQGKDVLQSIADLTPILTPHIQNALSRHAKKNNKLDEPIKGSEATVGIPGNDIPQSRKKGPQIIASSNLEIDIASLFVEGVGVIKETEDEDILKEWNECMDKARRLIEQAKKKRRLR